MISDAIALIDYLRKNYNEFKVLSAYFDWNGNKKEGSDKLSVEIIAVKEYETWFYKVNAPDDYVCVPMPVVAGVYVDHALREGEKTPDAKFFRYVNTPLSSHSGGAVNTKVDFIVYAYRPKDLIKARKET